jgi:hypothetical protein
VKKILLAAAMLAFISTAQAQGYVVQSPGHRPAYAIPGGNGTYGPRDRWPRRPLPAVEISHHT